MIYARYCGERDMERRGQDGIDICGDGSRISPKQVMVKLRLRGNY